MRKALEALGLTFKLVAVNHWPIAVESHKKNHPDASHYCINLDAARPIEIVPEGYLDLLMASPECTHHSRARGGKPLNDQSRMSCWHVVRWATDLRIRTILVENVREFVEFGPLNPRTMRPLKSRKGEYFLSFVRALENIGYTVDWRVNNAADFGEATTRERLFMIARSDGKPICWPEPTHSRHGGKDLFGEKLKWRAAREIIDWDLHGRSLFSRKKPLAEKTLARIYAGATKFNWPEPFLVVLRRHMAARSVDEPLPCLTAGGRHVGIVEQVAEPLFADEGISASSFVLSQASGGAARDVGSPLPTIVSAGKVSLSEPVLVEVNHGRYANGQMVRKTLSVREPLPAVTTKRGLGIAEAVLINMKGCSKASSIDAPAPTITAHARHLAVCEPLVAPYYGSGSGKTCKSVEAPLDTVTAKARFGVVEPVAEPFVISTRHSRQGAGPGPRDVSKPLPTITAGGSQVGVVEGVAEPFLVPQFGEREGQRPRHHAVSHPLPAVTSHGAGALVEPSIDPCSFVVQTDQTGSHGGCVRSVEDPLFTAVTKQNTALVEPLLEAIADDAVLMELAQQGRLVISDGRLYKIDVRFRMLEPLELARSMGFSDEESTYEFAGNKTEITMQIGNAVSVRQAFALVSSIFADYVQNGAEATAKGKDKPAGLSVEPSRMAA
jgi:DNA (cytosine-5)-methyltransferase 1